MSAPPSGLHDVSLKIGEVLANVEWLKESHETISRQMARSGAIDMAPAKVLRMKLPVAGPASLLV